MCSLARARCTNDQAARSTSRSRRSAGSGGGPAAIASCRTPSKLAEARKLVGSDRMVLDRAARTVWLKTPGMKLDVGGIAKGYAAQAALDVLKKAGVTRALVGGAGDIVVGDAPPGQARLDDRDRAARARQAGRGARRPCSWRTRRSPPRATPSGS